MNLISYALIMLVAGVGIPVMASLNSALGAQLHSPVLAVIGLLIVALACSAVVVLATGASLRLPFQAGIPWYNYLGGALFVLYILSITAIAPKFGVGNAVSFVLLGQLVAMCVIDHFGLMGAPRFTMTSQRLLGILLMAVGVFLAIRRN